MHIFIVFFLSSTLLSKLTTLSVSTSEIVSASFIKREIQKRAITSVNQAILAEKYQAEPKILKNTSNQQKTKFKKKTLQEKLKKSSSSRRKKGKNFSTFHNYYIYKFHNYYNFHTNLRIQKSCA